LPEEPALFDLQYGSVIRFAKELPRRLPLATGIFWQARVTLASCNLSENQFVSWK
jgi:hypothetical protein